MPLPPNAPELLPDDEPQVGGAFGGKPRTRKSKKKTKTRRQMEQAVRAELEFARRMRALELEMLMNYRLQYLAHQRNQAAGTLSDWNRRSMAGIEARWPYLTERDPVLADVVDRHDWMESKYHKLASDFVHHYGPLPADLILEMS